MSATVIDITPIFRAVGVLRFSSGVLTLTVFGLAYICGTGPLLGLIYHQAAPLTSTESLAITASACVAIFIVARSVLSRKFNKLVAVPLLMGSLGAAVLVLHGGVSTIAAITMFAALVLVLVVAKWSISREPGCATGLLLCGAFAAIAALTFFGLAIDLGLSDGANRPSAEVGHFFLALLLSVLGLAAFRSVCLIRRLRSIPALDSTIHFELHPQSKANVVARRPDIGSITLSLVAYGMLAVSIPLWLLAILHRSDPPAWIPALFMAFAFGFGWLAFTVLAFRDRLQLRDVIAVRALDSRPPILYIRPFEHDGLKVHRRETLLRRLLPFAGRTVSLEEVLVKASWENGPVIAIGRPGDRLRPLGAAREYVGDYEWRQRIEGWCRESATCVGVLGSSSGVQWEFLKISELGAMDRFVLIFPPVPDAELAQGWKHLRTSLNLTFGPLGEREGEAMPWALQDRRPIAALNVHTEAPTFIVADLPTEGSYTIGICMATNAALTDFDLVSRASAAPSNGVVAYYDLLERFIVDSFRHLLRFLPTLH